MEITLWNQVLSRLDPRDRRLREGLSATGLTELEKSLGLRLPVGYRSFLRAHDGGFIGDQKIYGSPEIFRLLELGRDRFRGSSDGDGAWRSFEAPYQRLLPIHPASSRSVECLSLDVLPRSDVYSRSGSGKREEDEAVIYWVRFQGQRDAGCIESITGIRDIDVDVLTWSQIAQPQVAKPQDAGRQGLEDPEIEPTYVDFLDWTLDAVLDAEGRRPTPFISGQATAQR